VPSTQAAVAFCDAADISNANADAPSSCDGPSASAGYTCYSNVPQADPQDANLAYAFVAMPGGAAGPVGSCGLCFEFVFTGTGHYNPADVGAVALKDKRLLVQSTNIGYDVFDGQFDVMIPGGCGSAFASQPLRMRARTARPRRPCCTLSIWAGAELTAPTPW
jgi:hypothetical protein